MADDVRQVPGGGATAGSAEAAFRLRARAFWEKREMPADLIDQAVQHLYERAKAADLPPDVEIELLGAPGAADDGSGLANAFPRRAAHDPYVPIMQEGFEAGFRKIARRRLAAKGTPAGTLDAAVDDLVRYAKGIKLSPQQVAELRSIADDGS